MARPRSNIFSKYIFLRDTSLKIQERFVSRKGIGETLAYAIIFGKTGISIDPAYDEMISELLDEFPILSWRKCVLNRLNDETVVKKKSAVTNAISAFRELYYYGMTGEELDQDLFFTQFPNTRSMFLTGALRNVIEESDM